MNKKTYYGKAIYNYKRINVAIKVLKNESLTLINEKKNKRIKKSFS